MKKPHEQSAVRKYGVKCCVAIKFLGGNVRIFWPSDGVPWAFMRTIPGLPYHDLRLPMEEAGLITCGRQEDDNGRVSNRIGCSLTWLGEKVAREASPALREEVLESLRQWQRERRASGKPLRLIRTDWVDEMPLLIRKYGERAIKAGS